MTSQEFSELSSRLDKMEKTLSNINGKAGFKCEWEDKKTDSDIQLAGGSTTITRTGVLVGTFALPHGGPGKILLMFVVRRTDGIILAIDAQAVKILDN